MTVNHNSAMCLTTECDAIERLVPRHFDSRYRPRTVLWPSVLSAVTEPIGTAHKRRAHRKGPARAPVPFFLLAGLGVTDAACWERVSPRTLHASGSQARQESLAPQATEAP